MESANVFNGVNIMPYEICCTLDLGCTHTYRLASLELGISRR